MSRSISKGGQECVCVCVFMCVLLLDSEELHKNMVDHLQIFFTLPGIHTFCNMTLWLFSLNSRVCGSIVCIWVGLVTYFGWYSAHFHAVSQNSANLMCCSLGYSTWGWEINGKKTGTRPTPETKPLAKYNWGSQWRLEQWCNKAQSQL